MDHSGLIRQNANGAPRFIGGSVNKLT